MAIRFELWEAGWDAAFAEDGTGSRSPVKVQGQDSCLLKNVPLWLPQGASDGERGQAGSQSKSGGGIFDGENRWLKG